MSALKRIFFAVLILVFSASLFSCSQKNYGHAHNKPKNQLSASTVNPVSTKRAPVEKKYILPSKKKRILGQQKPGI